MAKSSNHKKKSDRQPSPFMKVVGVFCSAYIKELRARDTFGYKLKGELANTAKAAAVGIQALRDYDPGAELRERQTKARDSSGINGKF